MWLWLCVFCDRGNSEPLFHLFPLYTLQDRVAGDIHTHTHTYRVLLKKRLQRELLTALITLTCAGSSSARTTQTVCTYQGCFTSGQVEVRLLRRPDKSMVCVSLLLLVFWIFQLGFPSTLELSPFKIWGLLMLLFLKGQDCYKPTSRLQHSLTLHCLQQPQGMM